MRWKICFLITVALRIGFRTWEILSSSGRGVSVQKNIVASPSAAVVVCLPLPLPLGCGVFGGFFVHLGSLGMRPIRFSFRTLVLTKLVKVKSSILF